MIVRVLTFLFLLSQFSTVAFGEDEYRVGLVPWAGFSPVNVAEQMGIWDDLGINVKVVSFDTIEHTFAALNHGLIDFTFEMVGSAVGHHMNGADVIVLAETNWSHGGDKLIIKRGLNINGQKGKTLGSYTNQPSILFFVNKYLRQQNLNISQFNIKAMEPEVLAERFISGSINLIIAYDPSASRAVREGNGKVIATSASFEGIIPECLMTTRRKLSKIPQSDVVNFLKGYIRASVWCQDPENWPEYSKILNEHTFEDYPTYSDTELKSLMMAVLLHRPVRLTERNSPNGGMTLYLLQVKRFLQQNKLLTRDFAISDMIDTTYIMKALEK